MKREIADRRERLVGLDMLRILSMILITFRHFINYAELTTVIPALSVNGVFVRLLEVLFGCSVNIFVLISGYLIISSSFKWERILKVWGETFFYSVGCFAVAAIFGLEEITVGRVILSFAPVLSRHYWFTVAYLAMYLLSPYLNKLLLALTEKEYTRLVLGGAVLLSAWTTFVYFSAGVLTGGNTSLLWFIYLYILGGYINLHRHKLPNAKWCAIGAAALCVGLLAYSMLSSRISVLKNFDLLTDDSVLELALSVCIVLLFLEMRGKRKKLSNIITVIGGSAFGVYLIQESCFIREWLWYRLVNAQQYFDKWYLIPVGCIVVLCLFAIAVLCHFVYARLYKMIGKAIQKIKR